MSMEDETGIVTTKAKMVRATLADGTIVYVQAKAVRGEEDIASITASFQKVTKAIEEITQSLTAAWEKAKPRRASVELGVEFAYESGEVLAMFVDGSTSASMKITLEWGEPSK
jgi:Trypsin-co-occurring domain 1